MLIPEIVAIIILSLVVFGLVLRSDYLGRRLKAVEAHLQQTDKDQVYALERIVILNNRKPTEEVLRLKQEHEAQVKEIQEKGRIEFANSLKNKYNEALTEMTKQLGHYKTDLKNRRRRKPKSPGKTWRSIDDE